MQPIVSLTRHSKNESHEELHRGIQREVQAFLRKQKNKAPGQLIFKAVFYLTISALAYASILWAGSVATLTIAYVVFGVMLVLLGFNFGHDLSHNAIFMSKKLNNVCFETLFALLGANGYLWKKRHLHSHHHYPNLDDHDADLELGGVIHLSPHQLPKPIHRFQHWYAPLLYASYTLYWIFYKDLVYFFRKKQANLYFEQHAFTEWLKLGLIKIGYVAYLLVLPWYFTPFGWLEIAGAFLLMHVLSSWFLLFTFLITHHVEHTLYPKASLRVDTSWIMHQVQSSNDFYPFGKVASFIFGGFNCHIAHHLLPNISHVHYPAVSKIVYHHLIAYGITPNQTGYFEGIWSHLRLLKRSGQTSPQSIVHSP